MFKIVKKAPSSKLKTWLLRLGAVAVALLAAMLLMKIMGYNPVEIFENLIKGSGGTKSRNTGTIEKAIPLTILSLGILIAFKMKFWNIGAEGQFYMGAFGASYFGLFHGDWPSYILIPVMMLAGMIMGGFWASISAFLKVRFGTNETLVTLMMNYIAILWISHLQYGPWRDPKAFGMPSIAKFEHNAWFPELFGINLGWVIALVLVAGMFFLLRYTKYGYEISVFGENPQTSRYAGMNNNKILLTAILISGGLCGLAGMLQSSGVEHSINDKMSAGMGFTAVIIAWLSQLSASGVLVVSVLFAMLLQGGDYIKTALQVPAALTSVLQGIILLFVLGGEFFMRYKIVWVAPRKQTEKKEAAIHE